MKKSGILHPELARVVAAMGHGDRLVVADAGLPVPPGVTRIDVAVTEGLPGFLPVVEAVAVELEVEHLTLARELIDGDQSLADGVQDLFPAASADVVSHDEFKELTGGAVAVVRTGETTPYANVILASGVTF